MQPKRADLLKSMVANKLTVPVQSGANCEFVVGAKDATICLHIRKELKVN